MGKTVCILIAGDYPYLNGESFYEDEAPYTSKFFDEVLVFSLNAGKKSIQTRNTPGNFRSFPIAEVSGRRKYVFYLLKGLLCHSAFSHSDFSLKHRFADDYLAGKSKVEFEKVKRILERVSFGGDTRFVVYSYWFFDHALLAVRIKEYLVNSGYSVVAVSRAHGYDLYPERNKLKYLPYRELLLDRLDKVFPCSQNGVDFLCSAYPAFRNKVKLGRLGTSDFGLKEIEGFSHTIATCCFLSPLKRMTFFAEVFCLLCRKDSKAKWICIGAGPDLSVVKKIIAEHNLNSRVLFTGALKKAEVIDIYKREDIALFCNVSEYEGVPVSIMEAQSFGIPVIATDVGGTREIVNEDIGALVDVDISAKSLAGILYNFLSKSKESFLHQRRLVRESWNKNSCSDRIYTGFAQDLINLFPL